MSKTNPSDGTEGQRRRLEGMIYPDHRPPKELPYSRRIRRLYLILAPIVLALIIAYILVPKTRPAVGHSPRMVPGFSAMRPDSSGTYPTPARAPPAPSNPVRPAG